MGLENGYGCTVNGAQTLFLSCTERSRMHSRPLLVLLLAASDREMNIQQLLAKLWDKALPFPAGRNYSRPTDFPMVLPLGEPLQGLQLSHTIPWAKLHMLCTAFVRLPDAVHAALKQVQCRELHLAA